MHLHLINIKPNSYLHKRYLAGKKNEWFLKLSYIGLNYKLNNNKEQ